MMYHRGMTTSPKFPFTVTAEVRFDEFDGAATAKFANGDRAGQYAQMLANSGDYFRVLVDDSTASWIVAPAKVSE